MAKIADPELHAMNVIRGAMEPLSEDQVRRVRAWYLDRYDEDGHSPTANGPKPVKPAEVANPEGR